MMILRVVKVSWFMFMCIWIYGWLRLTGSPGLRARLEKDFLAWTSYVLGVFGTQVRIEGREHIPAGEGRKTIIMSNHQSQLDIPALAMAMGRLIGFVAKQELTRIPLLSFWMRQLGCVTIDRTDKRGAHKALEKAAREVGVTPLVVFPEGTRSKDGGLLPFKLGGSRLAVLAEALIVPVLIEGTRDAAENRRASGKKEPIPVRVRIFPPMDTRGLDEGKASLNKIKEYVERCWNSPNGLT